MFSQWQSLLTNLAALALIVVLLFLTTNPNDIFPKISTTYYPPSSKSLEVAAVNAASSPTEIVASSSAHVQKRPAPAVKAATRRITSAKQKTPVSTTTQEQTAGRDTVTRIQNPYSASALSFDAVNSIGRAALVNILCIPHTGNLHAISGSGVVIDPRGVILTNAHVAQYVLLSEDPRLGLRCVVHSGSPAQAHWIPTVLYIPPVWVQEHAADISYARPKGTGEHDYALLLVTDSFDGSPLSFPALTPDTREGIAFLDDQILAAGYPAEFIGGLAAQNDLYAVSSMTTVKQLLTFSTGSIDVLSLGGIIEAQSGSSGGAVLNAWARLVGVITTTSEGDTTADRDLRAVTLSYVDRDLLTQTGHNLASILSANVVSEALDFNTVAAPTLIDLLEAQIKQ